MPEISKKEKQLDWACRILMTTDVLFMLAGYLSFFQTKHQLVSPLIPTETVYRIFVDGGDEIMKASIIAAIIFLAGCWLYTFRLKKLSLLLFIISPVCFKLFLL
jgi:hypothetical protein